MSIEELAEKLVEISHTLHIPKKVNDLYNSTKMTYKEAFIIWLNSDVDDG